MNDRRKTLLLLPVMLLFAVSFGFLIYVVFLQPGTAISRSRLVAAILAGGALAALSLYILTRPEAAMKVNFSYFAKRLIVSIFFCSLFWLVIPLPANYLFPLQTQFEVTVQTIPGSPAGTTRLTLLNSGLDYIPFRDVTYTPAIPNLSKGQAPTLVFDNSGKAEFSWQGRAWKTIQIGVISTQNASVIVRSSGKESTYSLNADKPAELDIPVGSSAYYLRIQSLFVLASIFALWIVLAMLGLLRLDQAGRWLESKTRWLPDKRLLQILAGIFFLVVVLLVISYGFQNRFYADDYCSYVELRKVGYLQAVWDWINQNTGRFTGHMLNFLTTEFPALNTVMGPLIAVVFIGGGFFSLFTQILAAVETKSRRQLAGLSALTFSGTLFLTVPFLYESFVWNLHSTNVSVGIGLFFAACALLIRNQRKQESFHHPILWGILFFVWGFFGAGLNEVISMLNLGIIGCAVLVILVKRKTNENRLVLTQMVLFLLGNAAGLTAMLLAPGDTTRLDRLGFALNLRSLPAAFITLIRVNTVDIFTKNDFLPLFLVLFLMAAAYLWGRSLPIQLPWNQKPLSFVEKLLLALSPFVLFLISFVPSLFISRYFPPRTLAVPLAYALAAGFVILFNTGNATKDKKENDRLLSSLLALLLVLISIPALVYLLNFSHQMSLFQKEWDARDVEIRAAAAAGKKDYTVIPYADSPGTDLSNTSNLWLFECEEHYYGINLLVNDK